MLYGQRAEGGALYQRAAGQAADPLRNPPAGHDCRSRPGGRRLRPRPGPAEPPGPALALSGRYRQRLCGLLGVLFPDAPRYLRRGHVHRCAPGYGGCRGALVLRGGGSVREQRKALPDRQACVQAHHPPGCDAAPEGGPEPDLSCLLQPGRAGHPQHRGPAAEGSPGGRNRRSARWGACPGHPRRGALPAGHAADG